MNLDMCPSGRIIDLMTTQSITFTHERITCTNDRVGDTFLLGRFGGAICSLYQIVEIADGVTRSVRVERKSVKNADCTYSSVIVPCS